MLDTEKLRYGRFDNRHDGHVGQWNAGRGTMLNDYETEVGGIVKAGT